MPSRIIDINELVGEDIVFVYGDPSKEYRLPGDIDVDSVFAMLDAFAALSTVKDGKPDAVADAVKDRFMLIKAQLLKLFQIRDPDLETWPFGMRGTGAVLKIVLAELGMNVSDADPPQPSPNRKTRRATAPKARVKR